MEFHLFWSEQANARAGGAGGGHSYGGGGHSYGGSHSYGGGGIQIYGGGGSGSGQSNGFTLFLIFLFVVYMLWRATRKNRSRDGDSDISNIMDSFRSAAASSQNATQDTTQLQGLGDQDPAELKRKVQQAFLTIQQGWSEKRVGGMRRYITDGIYQRFHAQFTMMSLLGQTNPVTNVAIQDIFIVGSAIDGPYQTVDVRIRAEADDQFVCEKFPELNTPGGREEFVEFWSFIRRIDHKKGTELYNSDACPQCGAPLTAKLVETARCPYCGTYLNSGEYDWVLAEITQEADRGRSFLDGLALPRMKSVNAMALQEIAPGFSKQVLEDRASNAFMQILIAMATRNVKALQKFSTAEAYQHFAASLPSAQKVYDRLYTRAVDLLTVHIENDRAVAFIGIRYSAHEILFTPEVLHRGIDGEPISQAAVLVMVREVSSLAAKGSVFAGACPACGAPQKDSLAYVCEFCGSALNDAKLDWVVAELLTVSEFRARKELFVNDHP